MSLNATYHLKSKMMAGKKVYGIEIGEKNDPEKTVKTLKKFGYDFIWLEFENTLLDKESAAEYIRVAHEIGMPIVMRPEDKTAHIRPYIIAGINGVIPSQVETVEDVAHILREVYFPPIGHRDAYVGAHPYSIDYQKIDNMPLHTLIEYVNNNTLVMPLCERLACIRNLPQILRLDGVTGAIFAPYDLSFDILSVRALTTDKKTLYEDILYSDLMMEKVRQMVTICKEAGKVAGIGVYPPKYMVEWAKIGYQLFIFHLVINGNVDDFKAPIEELKSLIE